MNCKDCGAEVANVGELKKHKKECPGKPEEKVTRDEPEQVRVQETNRGQVLIPWDKCDGNLKLLSKGTPTHFHFVGVITPEGVVVKDKVEVVRRGRSLI